MCCRGKVWVGGLIAAALAATSAGAQQVGTAGAVNPAAQSAAPGGSMKTMNVGGNVVFKERINTSDSGSVQLIFVDRTTMNIGPNSQLTIDEFVFDPQSNTGRMTATLTKGVMRFVGGQASHTGGATIKTPATTLGVRGGVATVRHDPQNGTRAINHFGTLTAQTLSGTEVIRRPGFALNVAGNNTPPTPPARAPQSEIDANNRQLTSAQQQTGGRKEVPTDVGASKTVGEANKQVSNTNTEGQQQNTAQAAQKGIGTNTENQNILQGVQQIAAQGGQESLVSRLEALYSVKPKPLPQRRFYALNAIDLVGSPVPDIFVPNSNSVETTILGYGPGGLDPDGVPNTSSRLMAAGISISGQGANQSSALVGMWATVYTAGSGETVLSGGIRGTSRMSATSNMGRLSTSLASVPDGVTLDGAYTPTTFTVNQNDINTAGDRTTQTGFYYLGNNTPGVNYTFTAQGNQIATPANLGQVRPTVGLTGYAMGLMRTDSLTSGFYNGPSFPVWGFAAINLSESSRFNAEFYVNRVGSSTLPSDNFQYANFLFGYRGDGTGSRSAYIDYDNFLAAESAINTSPFTRLSSVNGGGLSNHHAIMVNASGYNLNQAFPGVTFCNCEATRWGFWSSETRRTGVDSALYPDPVRDRLHMGTWVAGLKAANGDVPTSGSATYAGHIIGSFKAGANEYIAAGNFQNAVNFGTSAGSVSIIGLDGRNYAGSVSLSSGNRANFYGTLGTTAGPTGSIVLNGDFMKNTVSPVGEMGGGFVASGTGYTGAGTFAARAQ